MTDYQKQGKKNRASGAAFERKVRKDLEGKDWIVSKWMNNVEFHNDEDANEFIFTVGKLIPAKHKFRGPGIPMAIGTGFPDFIALKEDSIYQMYKVNGVEVKSNGYLTKEEKEKCKWLLEHKVFSIILIASKGKKRGEIVYKEFEE